MSQNFTNRGKERLLSPKGYSESGFFSESHIVKNNNNNNNEYASVLDRFKKRCTDVRLFVADVVEMGRSDPLQVIFAAKSGLALAIVCVLVLFKDSVSYLSEYAIWGILTVIVVFEFTAVKDTMMHKANKNVTRPIGVRTTDTVRYEVMVL